MAEADSATALEATIERYNDAWNSHDLDAIIAMHAPDMVFANHTAGESAQGDEVRAHIASIFDSWPDIAFATRRLYVREGLVVQEWTASATHTQDDAPRRHRRRAERRTGRVGRAGRDPVRGRAGQAQGRLLRLRLDPAPGGTAGLELGHVCAERCERHPADLGPIAEPLLELGGDVPVVCQKHQTRTDGPAPEIDAPIAPSSGAASTTSIDRG